MPELNSKNKIVFIILTCVLSVIIGGAIERYIFGYPVRAQLSEHIALPGHPVTEEKFERLDRRLDRIENKLDRLLER